jgi:hypothetical protein
MGSELNADEKNAMKMWLPKTAILVLSENHSTTIADLVAQLPGTVDGGGKRKADEISEEYSSNSDDCFDHVMWPRQMVKITMVTIPKSKMRVNRRRQVQCEV